MRDVGSQDWSMLVLPVPLHTTTKGEGVEINRTFQKFPEIF